MRRYSSIDIYSLQQRQWLKGERLPKLNHARQSHSSCALSGFVYVFGGDNASVNLLDSIERMQICSDTGYPSQTPNNMWELIQVVQSGGHIQRLARMSSIFCAIDETEILIAGGYLNEQDGEDTDGHASDAFILDTKTLEVHNAVILAPDETVPSHFDSLTN